jgi:glycosyltransferase involved in cell wall biosynthesis
MQHVVTDKSISNSSHRRLAVIDTKFPWKQSGFRYWENVEIYHQRPDTLFFATEPFSDPFPTHVFPISNFPLLAITAGITDLYCVFLNLTLSLLGECFLPNGYFMPGSNPNLNIKPLLDQMNIRLHTTIYPGGGLDPTTPTDFLDIVGRHCTSVFTNIEEVLRLIPNSIYQPVVINTSLYTYEPKIPKFPIEITFCAYQAARKGFPLMAQAFNELDDSFHLHIIGDWQDQLHLLKNKHYTYYGILNPEEIVPIYRKSHVFLNCSTSDSFALDGFPTTAAVDAMSTGCILVSTNPRQDHFLFQENREYLKVDADDYQTIVKALLWIRKNFKEALQIGTNGSNQIKQRMDAKTIVSAKLSHIFRESY